MAETDEDRMKALEARIAAAKAKYDPDRDHMEEHYSQAQLAWRMVIELVAGMGIGFGIGYGLDWVFGTKPWLMVVFILLGFIAGVKTMIRSAQEIQRRAEETAAETNDSADAAQGQKDGD